jgi:hypothetical protein
MLVYNVFCSYCGMLLGVVFTELLSMQGQTKDNCSSGLPKRMLLAHKDHPSNFSSVHTLFELSSWP